MDSEPVNHQEIIKEIIKEAARGKNTLGLGPKPNGTESIGNAQKER
jgi:hypothetical protein